MPTYKRCPNEVKAMAEILIAGTPMHHPLRARQVKIDFVFAFPDLNEKDQPKNDAIRVRSRKALGLTRVINLKDRTLGRGDVEVLLDGPWWENASTEDQTGLLDHELTHIWVSDTKSDDLGRPVIKLRQHDIEVGWFNCVAQRQSIHSPERIQAAKLMEECGQFYWPELEMIALKQPVTLRTLPSKPQSTTQAA